MKRVSFQTLGCKLNQIETDSLAAQFRQGGYAVVPFGEPTDVCIINTCTVTNKSDRKSRHTISHASGKAVRPLLVVTGCYAESSRQELEEKAGIDFLVPNQQKNLIFSLVDAHFRGEILVQSSGDVFDFQAHEKVFHTRAFIKIQDGCDHFCSYCIIPSVRGPAVSRPLPDVVKAAQEFIKAGARELVLSGINMGKYEVGDLRLSDLVTHLLELEGDYRLRISSLEPECLDEKLMKLFKHPRLCPQLHLCLQSGSNAILKGMNRPYTREFYSSLVSQLRRLNPNFVLTTDLIVGFPGETEEDFLESLSSVEEFGFAQVHVFKYSRRTGTKADRMPDQVAENIKTERSRHLQKKADEMRFKVLKTQMGRIVRVLVERVDVFCEGWSDEYLPVRFHSDQTSWNQFQKVRITHWDEQEGYLWGDPIFS